MGGCERIVRRMSTAHWDHREELHEIVREFLRRELVGPEVTERVERLRAEGKPEEALRLILEKRRDQSEATIPASTDSTVTE